MSEDSRFGKLWLRNGLANSTVDRMEPGAFNKPLSYSGRSKPYDVLSILIRTLHRLVNERVQRQFVLPDYEGNKSYDAILQPNCGVTREEAAKKFLHLSQRAFWRTSVLLFALANLEEDRLQLLAQVRKHLDLSAAGAGAAGE